MSRFTAGLLAVLSASQLSFAQTGTFQFLRNDVGARAAALNGSFVSMSDDPNLIFYNPGGLATMNRPRASVGYFKHLMDVNAGNIAYSQPLEGVGSIGLGITFIDYGTFTQTDASFNTLGTFGARELALLAGVGTSLDEQTTIGTNLKFIYSSIADYSASGLAVDLGVLYRVPSENLALGASIISLGRQLKTYAGTREALPLDIKVGVTHRPEHLPVYLNLDFHRLNEPASNLASRFEAFTVGAEFLMSESVRFRVGYNNEQRKELKFGTSTGLAGFSVGGGILVQEYQIDYAFNSLGTTLGGLHRISIGVSL